MSDNPNTPPTADMQDAGERWLADLEKAVADRDHPYYGRNDVLDDARRRVDELRGKHGLAPMTAAQVDEMYARHEKFMDGLDPENPQSLYHNRPQAAERARAKAEEEFEIYLRRNGVEPRPPKTIEEKVADRIDRDFRVENHMEHFARNILPIMDRQLQPLNVLVWNDPGNMSSAGDPLTDQEIAEYRALPEDQRTGKWRHVSVKAPSRAVIEDRRAALRQELGAAQFDQAVTDAQYVERFAWHRGKNIKLPANYDCDRFSLLNLANHGKYLRHYDDARARAKLPRVVGG